MKKLLVLILLACESIAFSQSTTEIDSSLMKQKGERYSDYYKRMTKLITNAESSGNYSEMNKYVYAYASEPDSGSYYAKDTKFILLNACVLSGHTEIAKKISEEILAVNPNDFEANQMMFHIYMVHRDKKNAKKYLETAIKNGKTDYEKKAVEISRKLYKNN